MNVKELVLKLEGEKSLSGDEFERLLNERTEEIAQFLFERARAVKEQVYGKDVFVRGLIEISNYCKNDCYYCGIRKSNKFASRYRLSADDIMDCCKTGYLLGFRTFVMQGGEDGFYSDDVLCDIIREIKSKYEDCALTLSLGERSVESYKRLYDAGADRYLLRHETANGEHYGKIHPPSMSLSNRKHCLYSLKDIGYQVGCGFMVGSPFQTMECIVSDLLFIKELKPHMVGVGPYLPHDETPFHDKDPGSLELTLFLVAIIRLMIPAVLLPATTALGTIHPRGRELGILAGANVVMPNLSPVDVRAKYMLYNNKICTGDEAAECKNCLSKRMESVGARLSISRGDYKSI